MQSATTTLVRVRAYVILAMLAIVTAAALVAFQTTKAEATTPLDIDIACSPVSDAQVPAGTVQNCTLRVKNLGSQTYGDVEIYQVGGWTLTSVTPWKRVRVIGPRGWTYYVTNTEDLYCPPGEKKCIAESLAPGELLYMKVTAVRPVSQDGIGRSTGCVKSNSTNEACAPEQASLP